LLRPGSHNHPFAASARYKTKTSKLVNLKTTKS
jgi:hypothetical protein